MGKRLFDICFSFTVLLLGLPLFLLCILAIKCTSPGSAFYAHPRIGLKGKPFGCFKFRTMYADSEKKLKTLLATNPALRDEWDTYYKLKEDPRVTPIGKWLRKTSLDEIPQFLNVLKGEMSLVGPRPLTDDEVKRYLKERAPKILSVKPGITTLWTVKGRNRFTLEERIQMEEFYIDNRSFLLDCRLILQTALKMIFPTGAY